MADDDKTPQGFSLKRWSHRKIEATREAATAETPAPAPSVSGPVATPGAAMVPAAEPALPPVESLTSESDFAAFMRPKVDEGLRRQALKKLFADPHFNVMDGLDVYIDDYTKPDPLPLASIRKMAQAAFLGLVEATPPPAPEAAQTSPAPAPMSAEVDAAERGPATAEPDEDADLRLQPHDAAGCGGAEDGAAADERRQS